MNTYFEEMLRRLKITVAQKQDAVTKYTSVSKLLHSEFYESSYDGSTKLLIGSYGKHTNIRPPEDIDLLFKIPEDIYLQYENCPGDLLQRIRKAIEKSYSTTEEIHAWGKVVLVKFKDGTHNVELLPGFDLGSTFMIPNTENGGLWESFDVRTEMQAIANSDKATNGTTRKLIRMIKKWSKITSTVTIKSFKIEEYCVEFLATYDLTDMSWSHLIHDFFVWLSKSTQDDKTQIQTAITRSTKAIAYEDDDEISNACLEWQKVFGKKTFPAASAALVKALNMSMTEPSLGEMYIEDIATVKINPLYKVTVSSNLEGVNYKPHDFAAFIRGRSPVAKHKSILFTAEVEGLNDFQLMWKVRNFGSDARRAGGLRGEIRQGNGTSLRESTLYKGLHYVECYAIKDDVCVARSLIFVPIGDN